VQPLPDKGSGAIKAITVALIPTEPASITVVNPEKFPGPTWPVSWSGMSGETSYTLQRTTVSTGTVTGAYTDSATSTSDYTGQEGL